MKNQKRCAGQQKVAKHRVKSIKPNSAFVLVYSFGDEMYRWARVSSLLKPFKAHVDDVYTNKGKKASISNHLRTADVAPFNGREALHEAEEELRRQQREREQAQQTRQRETEYQSAHGLAGALRPSVGNAVRVLSTGRLGKIVRDDHDGAPYRVQYNSGEFHSAWLEEQGVSKVAGVATPQRRNSHAEDGSPTKRARSSLPDYLRGEIAAWTESVERGEATDCYNQDDIKRALAILKLEPYPTETLLKKAFRKKTVECHTDKVPVQRRAWATGEMRPVNGACNLLAKMNGVVPSSVPAQLPMLTE